MPDGDTGRDRLKQALFDSFRAQRQTQYLNVVHDVERRLEGALPPGYEQTLLELVHELIVSNVVMTGMNAHNTGWPWLAVTTHGAQLLAQEGPPVYDYEGFIRDIKGRVPNLDPITERYLSESLQAYQRNLFYASMVMLGIAAERSVRVLIDSYVTAIKDDAAREKLRSRLNGRDIGTAYARFRESFDSTRSQIQESSLPRDFDIHVDGIFSFVRLLRNSVVHPDAMPAVTSAMVAANLQQFSFFATALFRLAGYFASNQVTP